MQINFAQPQGIGSIWGQSFKLAKACISKIWYWLLIYFIIGGAISFFAGKMGNTMTSKPALISFFIGIFILMLIIGAFFFSVLYLLIQQVFTNNPEPVASVIKTALRKIPKYLAVYIIGAILVLLGTIAFVLPGIYMMIPFWLMFPVIFLEELGVFATIKRAFSLVWGNWWRTFLILIVPVAILMVIFLFVIHATGGFPSPGTPSTPPQQPTLTFRVLTNLIGFIFAFYFLPLSVVQYHDLKLRKQIKEQNLTK